LAALGAGRPATPTKDEAGLIKKARERIDALDAASAEYRKLDDGFVASVMDFARANLVKDPAIAAEALKAVLAVHPDHQDAKSLLAKLPAAARGPEAAPAAPTSAELGGGGGQDGQRHRLEGPARRETLQQAPDGSTAGPVDDDNPARARSRTRRQVTGPGSP
jgi:hypothetical protein